MKSTILAALALAQVAFGGYIDCDKWTSNECAGDDECYLDTSGGCRANCSKILFFPGNGGPCESANGCVATINYDVFGEGEQPCSFKDTTTTTSSPTTTTTTTTTTSQPTESPTSQGDTPPPTTTTTTTTTTTDAPTTTTPNNDGNGRCKADGSIQEQRFPPSTYQCGDHNLGQPEERCIYIDASSSCTGTNFGDCGNETAAWPTFQSALDSLNGETVVLIVKAGTYSGAGNVNITSPNINSLNEYVYLNIFSESGSDETIIDCKGEGFGFHLYQTTIRMDGFTVINCVAPKRPSFSLPSYATNDYINTTGAEAGRLGGAFFLDRTFITMNDMIIVNNGAEFGGGIFQYQNSIRMNNSIVEYNCATNSGGGIFLLFANLYMWNSYVLCNSADVFGGGIFGHQQRTDILDNALVDDNEAEYADQLFCDRTTVNVDSDNNGFIADNDVLNWEDNAVTYCCCNNCAFYNLDRSIDFCAASDNSKVNVDIALAADQGECAVAYDATPAPTNIGDTAAPTTTPSPVGISPNGVKTYSLLVNAIAVIFMFSM